MIADALETETTRRSPAPARSSRRPTRVALLIAASVALLSLIVAALPGHGRPSGLGPLNAAAAVAATQPSTIAPPGRYFHVLEQYNGFAPLGHKSNVRDSYEWGSPLTAPAGSCSGSRNWNPGPAPRGCGCHLSGKRSLSTAASVADGLPARIDTTPSSAIRTPLIRPRFPPTRSRCRRNWNICSVPRQGVMRPSTPPPAISSRAPPDRVSPGRPDGLPGTAQRAVPRRRATARRDPAEPRGRSGREDRRGDDRGPGQHGAPNPHQRPAGRSSGPSSTRRPLRPLAWEVVFTNRGTTWAESRTFLEPGIVSSTHSVP